MRKEDFKEELLCCINVLEPATGLEIFRPIKNTCEKEINWKTVSECV